MFHLFPAIYFKAISIAVLSLLLTACSAKIRTHEAPSIKEYEKVSVEGYKNIRYWGDKTSNYTYTKSNIKRLGANKRLIKSPKSPS